MSDRFKSVSTVVWAVFFWLWLAVFIPLKLWGTIDHGWLFTLLPIWLFPAIVLGIVVVVCVAMGVSTSVVAFFSILRHMLLRMASRDS